MGGICSKYQEDNLAQPLLNEGSAHRSDATITSLKPDAAASKSSHKSVTVSSNAEKNGTDFSEFNFDSNNKNFDNLFKSLKRGKNGTFVFNSKQTLRRVHKHKKDSARHKIHKQLQTMLSSGTISMYDVVKKPEGQDRSEWLVVHVVDFFNEVCLLFGAIMDVCTIESCPTMSAGRCTYLWADGKEVVKPKKVPAHEYVDYLMTWIDEQINQLDSNSLSPKAVEKIVRTIFKRMFRVYAHMYDKHFKQFLDLGAEKHLNTCFERFLYFILEFKLVEEKELEPLETLVERYIQKRADLL